MARGQKKVTHSVLWPDADGGPWEIALGFERIGDQIECTSLDIHPLDGGRAGPLSRSLLKSLPLGRLVERALDDDDTSMRLQRLAGIPNVTKMGDLAGAGLGPLADTRNRGGRPPKGEAHYQSVAEIYRRSASKPTKAVQKNFNVPYATAATWVRKAREKGYLPPTTRGRRSSGQETSE